MNGEEIRSIVAILIVGFAVSIAGKCDANTASCKALCYPAVVDSCDLPRSYKCAGGDVVKLGGEK